MYRVFKRSATSYEEYSSARKFEVVKVRTIEEARRICEDYNLIRSAVLIAAGTKYEFEELD